MCQATAAVN